MKQGGPTFTRTFASTSGDTAHRISPCRSRPFASSASAIHASTCGLQHHDVTWPSIGFGSAPVVVSVLIEALALAVIGGALGGALAYLYCDGASLATLNFSTFSQVAFDLEVTPRLLMKGLVWSLIIGLLGGLPPAVRAARLPVTIALRAI